MRRRVSRPFNLGDLMIMVAAVACGFAIHRWVDTPIDRMFVRGLTQTTYINFPATNWFDYLAIRTPSYYVFAATVALVATRWRRPRPPARWIMRQPGAVACLAVVGSLLYGFLLHYIQEGLRVDDPNGSYKLVGHGAAWDGAVRWVSAAVAGVWAALAYRGHWSSERSWVDRVGRCLGIYWLIYAPANQLLWPFFAWLLPIPPQPDFQP